MLIWLFFLLSVPYIRIFSGPCVNLMSSSVTAWTHNQSVNHKKYKNQIHHKTSCGKCALFDYPLLSCSYVHKISELCKMMRKGVGMETKRCWKRRVWNIGGEREWGCIWRMDRHMHALKSTLVVPLHLLQFSRNRPRTLSRLGNRISVVLCDRPSF